MVQTIVGCIWNILKYKGKFLYYIYRGIQSFGPLKTIYTSPPVDIFIPTPTQLLFEAFSHTTITARNFSFTYYIYSSITLYNQALSYRLQLSELMYLLIAFYCRVLVLCLLKQSAIHREIPLSRTINLFITFILTNT